MRQTLTLILILLGGLCSANMGSPTWRGTSSGSAISSRNIDIVRETIHVAIGENFKTASYRIEYFIRTEVDGQQIPLLFHASGYEGDFKIWVDGQEVELLRIPTEYSTPSNTPFERFSNSFKQPSQQGEPETVLIYWNKNIASSYKLNDLKYFEADLTKGEHTIRVEYTANARYDRSGWINEYSFLYSLSPARNWKSFGSLEVILDGTDFNASLTTSLGQPSSGNLDSIAVWSFNELPADYFGITYKPQISSWAKALITISPLGMTVIVGLLIILLHFISIKRFREREPRRKYSWVMIVGSILVPIVILASYVLSYELIDSAIGAEAGRYHGFIILTMFLYPILLPVYWLFMWQIDKAIKREMNNTL